MFSTVLQELQSYFNRDFVLSAFFPLLIFFGTSLALLAEITVGLGPALAEWDRLSAVVQGVTLLSGLVFVTFVAYLADNLHYTLMQLFEGNWSRITGLSHLRAWRIKHWQASYDYLDALARTAATDTEWNEIVDEQLQFYPPPTQAGRLTPTKLGNILRAAELHALDRYGIDPAVIWPRLRPLLKPEAVAALEVKQRTIRFMLLMTVLSFVFAVFWCPVLALRTERWDLVLLCGWGGLLLAWICYHNATESALGYGAQIKAIFDLYRNELLAALKLPVPEPGPAERLVWTRLTYFWYRNQDLPVQPPGSPNPPTPTDRMADAVTRTLDQLFPPQPGAPENKP